MASINRNATKPHPQNGYPFFGYKDFSRLQDLGPTAPFKLRPNFVETMHAILNRPDLESIVAWLPHGRSWRVLKPREFEVKVLPAYFHHAKFSSFIRQAHGWGFQRITKGRDRNSFFHPRFLRGLPHLCKGWRRPGPTRNRKKLAAAEEPDFHEISRRCPLHQAKIPEDYTRTQHRGRQGNARFAEALSLSTSSCSQSPRITPWDEQSLSSFAGSLRASEQVGISRGAGVKRRLVEPDIQKEDGCLPLPSWASSGSDRTTSTVASPMAAANQLVVATAALKLDSTTPRIASMHPCG